MKTKIIIIGSYIITMGIGIIIGIMLIKVMNKPIKHHKTPSIEKNITALYNRQSIKKFAKKASLDSTQVRQIHQVLKQVAHHVWDIKQQQRTTMLDEMHVVFDSIDNSMNRILDSRQVALWQKHIQRSPRRKLFNTYYKQKKRIKRQD